MNIHNSNNNVLGTSSHKSDGVVGDKNSPLTLSYDEKKHAKETRNTKMSKLFRTKAKVTPLPLSIDASMNGSMRERLPAVTVTPSINAASPQAEMTIEQVSVDEAPPLPLTFQEQQQQEDQKEKLRLPAVTVTPSINAASPQAEMTIEQVPVDAAPPLPLTFLQQEEDHKEKLLLRDRGRGMKRIYVREDRLTEGSMKEEEDIDLPNGTGGVASVPKFYAVEAKLVDESSASSDVPIYDAVLVVPWWKRRKVISAIVTMLLLAVIAIIAWATLHILTYSNRAASRPQPPLPLPPVPLNCSAMSLGTWYDEDCDATCDHVVIVNQDITIAYRAVSGEEIQISSVSADDGTSQSLASHAPIDWIQDMALSKNTIAAGIPWADHADDDSTGIVSMFERNSSSGKWNRTMPIIPDNINKTANFGSSVSIDGSIMVVGAPDDGEKGSVFIYRKEADSWAQVAKVFGDQYTEDFGSSVIVKGNLIVVSDHAWTDPNNSDDTAGAVFLYRFDPVTNSMKLEETLINKDCDGKFGSSVVLQDEDDIGLFVGCPDDDTATGAVYYYKVNTSGTSYEAVLKQKIRASTPEPLYRFGDNVAFGGKYLAVGTHRNEAKLHEKVHIFIEWEDRWREVLVIDSPRGTHWFGFNIAMYNENIVISSWDNVYSYQLTCVDV